MKVTSRLAGSRERSDYYDDETGDFYGDIEPKLDDDAFWYTPDRLLSRKTLDAYHAKVRAPEPGILSAEPWPSIQRVAKGAAKEKVLTQSQVRRLMNRARRRGRELPKRKANNDPIRGTRGNCSLCCKLQAIPELDKPADKWCQHCRPGKGGCSIYNDRPNVCQAYMCLWLDGLLGDEWQPTSSKIVVQSDESAGRRLLFLVDHSTPDRWREPPYYKQILAWSEHELRAEPAKRYTTYLVSWRRHRFNPPFR